MACARIEKGRSVRAAADDDHSAKKNSPVSKTPGRSVMPRAATWAVWLASLSVAVTAFFEGEHCEENWYCAGRLVCIYNECVPPPTEVGAQCENEWHCGGGLACIERRCAKYETLGNACEDSDDCDGVLCWKNVCSLPAKEGEKCDESDSEVYSGHLCDTGLFCVKGVCKEKGYVGDFCEDGFDCAFYPVALGRYCEASMCCTGNGICSQEKLPSNLTTIRPSPEPDVTTPPTTTEREARSAEVTDERESTADEDKSEDEGDDDSGISGEVVGSVIGGAFALLATVLGVALSVWVTKRSARARAQAAAQESNANSSQSADDWPEAP